MEQEITQVVASAKELSAKAPTGKVLAAVEAAIRKQLIGLEQGLVRIQTLIEKGDYLDAAMQVKVLTEKGAIVSGEIQATIEKVGVKTQA